jgi:phage tail-like protein
VAATKIKFEPLTVERYVDGSPEDKRFQDWFGQTFKLATKNNGGSSVRKNGMIEKLHNGVVVLRFSFQNAWVKSSKFTDLEAGSNNLMKQTIVLEHEGLQREPV